MAAFESSVPGIFNGLLGFIRTAASEQAPEVAVYPYGLAISEPRSYVIVGPIAGPEWIIEALPLQLNELYEITGKVVVYRGETPSAEQTPQFAEETLAEAFSIFTQCVMLPALEHRGAPTYGTKGPNAQKVEPREGKHESGTGVIEGQQGGWMSMIDWSIHFEAILNPAPQLP